MVDLSPSKFDKILLRNNWFFFLQAVFIDYQRGIIVG